MRAGLVCLAGSRAVGVALGVVGCGEASSSPDEPDGAAVSDPEPTPPCALETLAPAWDLFDVAGDATDGTVYVVAGRGSDRALWRLADGGVWEEVLDNAGRRADPGVFRVDAVSSVVYARSHDKRVWRLAPGGLWEDTSVGPGWALAADADGFYVDVDGPVVRGASEFLGEPSGTGQVYGLAVHEGVLYAVRTQLSRHDGGLQWTTLPGAVPQTLELVAGAPGLFVAGGSQGLHQYHPESESWLRVTDAAGDPGAYGAHSLAFLGDTLLYTDKMTGAIRRLVPHATWDVLETGDGWTGARNLAGAACDDEACYVADFLGDVVWRRAAGRWHLVVDAAGNPGSLDRPSALEFDGDALYVGDEHSLHVLRPGQDWDVTPLPGLSTILGLARATDRT